MVINMKKSIKLLKNNEGFSLIELVVVIIILGILSAVTIRSITSTADNAKFEATLQEMDVIADAFVGDPDLKENGVRTDYGYVGDVGGWPTSLADLQNPAIGNGPYLKIAFNENSDDYSYDGWNAAYTFPNSYTIQSSGGGVETITKQIVNSTDDALNNTIIGNLTDWNGSSPLDSDLGSFTVTVQLQSGLTDLTGTVSSGGIFEVTGVHIGNHTITAVYDPPTASAMTQSKYISMNLASVTRTDLRFSTTFEGTGGSGGGTPQADDLAVSGDATIGTATWTANGILLGNTGDDDITIDQMTVSWSDSKNTERFESISIDAVIKWENAVDPQKSGTTQTLTGATLSSGAADLVLEIIWSSSYNDPSPGTLSLTFTMGDGSSKSYP